MTDTIQASAAELGVPDAVYITGADALVLAGCAMLLQRWFGSLAPGGEPINPAGLVGEMADAGFLHVEASAEGARVTMTLTESFLGALVRTGEALGMGEAEVEIVAAPAGADA